MHSCGRQREHGHKTYLASVLCLSALTGQQLWMVNAECEKVDRQTGGDVDECNDVVGRTEAIADANVGVEMLLGWEWEVS